MPSTEIGAPGGRQYQPSHAPSRLKALELEWSKLFASSHGDAMPSHTLVTRQSSSDLYNAAPFTMAPQTYSQADILGTESSGKSLAEALFDAGATAKILTSRVSMYLREGWRDKLFFQLDNLLDPEEWDPDDKPLQAQSFDTFLKAVCDMQPTRRPGLGLTYGGNLIAGWRDPLNGEDRVSLEFSPSGTVLVIGSRMFDGEPVSFSARTPVRALKKTMADLNCAKWLGCD